jgi:hypothetical protein
VAGTASFDPDQRTYRDLAKACIRHPCASPWPKRIGFVIIGVFVVFFASQLIDLLWQSRGPGATLTDKGRKLVAICVTVLVIQITVLTFNLTPWQSQFIGRRMQKRMYAGRVHVEWDDYWLRFRDDDSVYEKAWSKVHSAREMGAQLAIFFRDTSVVVVPKEALLDGQLAEIYGIVESASSGRAP